ncbi:hypothetical protein [Butyricimonas paravirosa]
MWWKKKKKVEDKQLSNLRWVMWIVGVITCLMPIVYMLNFWDGIISDESSDWGAFGAYMGAITGLLAFLGVLYTIRQSSIQAVTRDERDLFFKLVEENQKTLDSLIFPAEKKEDVTHGIIALESYVKDINADFQLLVVLTSSRGCDSYEEWIKKITPQEIHDEETRYYVMVYTNLIDKILEVVTPSKDIANAVSLHKEDPEQLQTAREECYKYIDNQLEDVEKGDLDTEKFYIAKILASEPLALIARWIWWHSDDLGRFRVLEYTANVFYKKYLNEIIYHFNNVGYLIYTINSFVGRDKDFYMKYLRSKLSANESYLLLFYITSDNLDVDIFQTVIDYKILDNIGKRDVVNLKIQDHRGAGFAYDILQAIIEVKKEEKRRSEEK